MDETFLVFGHGSRLAINRDSTDFLLSDKYNVATLHIPDKPIYEKLIIIILNNIQEQSINIQKLFDISNYDERKLQITIIENNFIKNYLIKLYNRRDKRDELISILTDYGLFRAESGLFTFDVDKAESTDDLTQILATRASFLNYLDSKYNEIKEKLNFEIRLYRAGHHCPKLALEFKIDKKYSNFPGGVYKCTDLLDFDYSNYGILSDDPTTLITSLIPFNESKLYVFDEANVKDNRSRNISFFDTIKSKINSGLLIVLSCGIIETRVSKLNRSNSDMGQRDQFGTKYYIDYN